MSVYFQQATIVINRLEQDCNKEILNISITFSNQKNHDTSFNCTAETYAVLLKILVEGKLYLPEDKNDENFQRLFFRTSVDVEKVLKNNYGNVIVQTVLENFLKSLTFVLSFPLKTVSSKFFFCDGQITNEFDFQKGNYSVINYSVSDKFIPFALDTKFLGHLRLITKIPGKKTFVHMCKFKFFGEVIKGIL